MVQTEAEAAAATASTAPAVTFSMELNDEQRQMQKWVHDFAKDVIRPAAHEWDEREETPWPIIEEAAKVGIYSWEFVQNSFADPTGLMMPIVNEEITWGDAGIGLSLFGSSLAVAGIVASGTMEQVVEWVPQCFGTPEKIQLGAFGVSEADAGSDFSSLKSRAVYNEAKDEWTLNGTKSWITNGGIADVHILVVSVEPRLGSRGHAAFVIPPGTKGISQGQKYLKHGIRASHTAEVVLDDCTVPGSCLLGGKEKLDARLARARGQEFEVAGGDGHVRSIAAGRRRTGSGCGARRVRVRARLRQRACPVRARDHREPGDRLQARRHEDCHRRFPAVGVARRLDGQNGPAVHSGRGLDVEAVRRRDRGQGHR